MSEEKIIRILTYASDPQPVDANRRIEFFDGENTYRVRFMARGKGIEISKLEGSLSIKPHVSNEISIE